jgi:hypothetical protein
MAVSNPWNHLQQSLKPALAGLVQNMHLDAFYEFHLNRTKKHKNTVCFCENHQKSIDHIKDKKFLFPDRTNYRQEK